MGDKVSSKEGLCPVKACWSGKGLPYAPLDWSNPGDTWYWSVGSRTIVCGFYRDRYIYPPERLRVQDPDIHFGSKAAVKRYITSQFPNADVDDFFTSFSRMVPTTINRCSEGEN
ncbi:hypothetical protein NL676_039874 [Syzygium grande]|nr:hypothetical protein NL676_039874 [Syzygium grande]